MTDTTGTGDTTMSTTSERAARPMAQRLPDRLVPAGVAEDILTSLGYNDEIDCALRAASGRDGWFRLREHLIEYSPGERGGPGLFLIRSRGGPDVLRATVTAASLPGLQAAARVMARGLYGEGANLRVEDISSAWNITARENGAPVTRFTATVTVRCLDFDWDLL